MNPLSTLSLLVLVALSGCTCGARPPPPPDGGFPGATTLRFPRETVAMLEKGIPLDLLDSQILSLVNANDPITQVKFWQEYQYGPGLSMVSLPSGVVGKAEELLSLPGNAGDPDRELPPLERDFVTCDRTETDHVEYPIPTSPSGQYPPFVVKMEAPLPNFHVYRMRGDLASLRFTGTSTTTFTVAATARDLHFDFVGGTVEVGSVTIVCPAVIGTPAGACGDTLVRCVAPQVVVTNVTGSGLGTLLNPTIVRDTLVNYTTTGLNLHFNNFAATGLTLVNNGMLTVTGTENLGCSPHPEPLPPTPPVRALTQVAGIVGQGELIGDQGGVMPFDLVPEAQVQFELPVGRHDVMPFTALDDGAVRTFATELRSDQPWTLRARTQLERRFANKCFQAPVTVQQLLDAAPERLVLHTRLGGGDRSKASAEELAGESMRPQGAKAIDEEEAATAFAKVGRDLPKCGKDACAWTRVSARLALPLSPLDAPMPFEPWEIEITLGLGLEETQLLLTPEVQCGGQKPQKVVGERRFAAPGVAFYPFMVDSATVPSAVANGVGLLPLFIANTFVRRTFSSSSGVDSTVIWMTDKCVAHDSGAPRGASCWQAPLGLPPQGTVRLTDGFSGTLNPRARLTDLFATGNVQVLGNRTMTVQGLGDRGAIQVFTAVPIQYRLAGATQDLWDFRGEVFLDWNHGSSFSLPSDPKHHAPRVARYSAPRFVTPFFTQWKTDQIRLRYKHDAPRSFCTTTEDVFATPLAFELSGGGLAGPKTVPAGDVLDTGRRDAQLRFQVAPGVDARGDLHRVSWP